MNVDNRSAAAVYLNEKEPKRTQRFYDTWMILENGWGEDVPNNNPTNLSYQGGPLPTPQEIIEFPWFEHVVSVNENRTCVFDSLEHGCDAMLLLISHYWPTVDTAKDDIEALTILGGPNINGEHWASNPNYGVELVNVYNELTKQSEAAKLRHEFYRVVGGNDLDQIARRFHTTVAELMKLNPEIGNANRIFVGQTIRIK